MRRGYLWFAIGALFISACTTRKVEPSSASRKIIDSLYHKEVAILQPKIDADCKKFGDSLFLVSRDSILKVRLADMNLLVK